MLLNIGDVVFQLSDKQHHIIYSIIEKLDWYYKRQRFQKGRPYYKISELEPETTTEAKKKVIHEWWNWVINQHYEPIKRYHVRKSDFHLKMGPV